MPSRPRAFTLVELLVVIGIVAVLIALLMPALVKVRKHAQEVHCAANLRSIGQALTMYTQRYEYYPGLGDGAVAVWPVRLRAFMGDDQDAFYCPAQDERCQWVKGSALVPPNVGANADMAELGYRLGEPLVTGVSFFSYGYNGEGTASRPGSWKGLGRQVTTAKNRLIRGDYYELKASRVRMPAEMIAVADTVADGYYDHWIHPWHKETYPGDLHRGGANVLFCDGHVQWYPQKILTHASDLSDHSVWAIRRMWNADNWASETEH